MTNDITTQKFLEKIKIKLNEGLEKSFFKVVRWDGAQPINNQATRNNMKAHLQKELHSHIKGLDFSDYTVTVDTDPDNSGRVKINVDISPEKIQKFLNNISNIEDEKPENKSDYYVLTKEAARSFAAIGLPGTVNDVVQIEGPQKALFAPDFLDGRRDGKWDVYFLSDGWSQRTNTFEALKILKKCPKIINSVWKRNSQIIKVIEVSEPQELRCISYTGDHRKNSVIQAYTLCTNYDLQS